MAKTPKRLSESQVKAIAEAEKMDTISLVDSLGAIKANISALEDLEGAYSAEILKRADGASYVDGNLFTATVVAEGMTTKYNTAQMELDMGERWMRKYLISVVRSAYVKMGARKSSAAA